MLSTSDLFTLFDLCTVLSVHFTVVNCTTALCYEVGFEEVSGREQFVQLRLRLFEDSNLKSLRLFEDFKSRVSLTV